ncbi:MULTISPECIES: dihydrodipicolinate synthase family protein [Auritidibacter]|uniref:Dihydrodipicolinate synthase family protein n=1 Tax=Auritidibacter ignavus TaxID=678932 RepID=A0AAJ6AGA2_9MICC|nr:MULTISPECIES: dihydrodipicolinate synthase family protein [Auritidibacter]PXA78864.1 dihydrodipicolinate synthase family protein [Auritidibacter sp. NML120779]NIH71073.1 4-hydroxy-tetrahydrodipicolinate synthase [Auritidibacter ignavus]PXA79234.1 dihydrodipicolinate synthase family protein [Auritidibacter sp. NML120636]RMX22399.1 dihydrodipicolinate synthase family protein [Auritidibacter ignavus]WGH81217.1 dihydrodipicolinate synthase family protein [Auritidibacter ignavus]
MFNGVYTPSITPLQNGSFDFDNWKRHLDHLVEAGIDGVLLFGSIGEFYGFTLEQKKEAVAILAEHLDSRIQLLVGTGATRQEDVIELSNFSREHGADAVVVVSPYYFGPSECSAEKFFATVAESVHMPVMLYNFPARTGSDLGPELVTRLASKYQNIVGIKDTVDSASHTREVIQAVSKARDDFSVLSGFDEYYLTNRVSGGAGILSGLTNVEPELFVRLHRAYQAKHCQTVVECATRITSLMRLYDTADLFISAIKVAVKTKGLPISTEILEPGVQADQELEKSVSKVLKS